MPGSGKSYIGKRLAEKLDYTFVELDSILEQEFNLPLENILVNLGEDSFLEKQAEDVILNTKNQNGLVVSPGGSIVYTDYAMEYLDKISKILYLETSLETIKERIEITSRGIVGLKDRTLEELYNERILLYKKYASATVNGEQGPDDVIYDIMSHISNLN